MPHRTSFTGFGLLAGFLGVLAVPTAGSAQARTQFTPFFSSFYALSNYGSNISDGNGGTYNERLSSAPALGGRLSVALSRAIGIEGQFAYVFTGRLGSEGKDPAGNTTSLGVYLKGNAIMASGRVTIHPRRSNFRGILGVGYQKRGGDAWNEAQFGGGFTYDKTSIGGIVGFGVRANVTPTFAMDLDVEAFLYSNDASSTPTFSSKFQQDVMVSIGVPIGFGGK